MKKIFIVFVFILAALGNIYAQKGQIVRNTATERAPFVNTDFGSGSNNYVEVYNGRWFGQNAAASSFFTKGFLNSAAAHTNFGPSSTSLFGAMEFDQNGVLYCIAVAAGSPLQTLDTTTGTLTTLGAITGLGSEQVLGMSFNVVTNTMYITTIVSSGFDKLYTLNLTTRVATLVGSGSHNMFDIAINSTGQCYAISVDDNLLSVNLSNGATTVIGSIGFDANFIQGASFDRSTDTLWYAAYNNTVGAGQLRTVNLSTGATTLIGTFNPAAEICGFCIKSGPSLPPLPLNPFALQSPPAGTRVVTQIGSTTPVTISWDTSSRGATYKWVFGSPTIATRRLTIDNGGSNTITTTLGALDALLAANGFTNNGSATDSAVGEWTVWAKKGPGATGPDSLSASNGPRSITLRRGQLTLAPLNQDFSSTTFPPPLWALEGGGTMYWLRDAVGGYQVGSGSAKYDFYSAQTTTPLQSLVSQEFLPVTSPTNYLRFNYSHAGYIFTTTGLAPDTCIIETSTNNGSTWTVLLRMGASQTPVGGYNSSPVMSTQPPLSTGPYTPSAANMWATKILSMPVGTNKVRFTAKSGYGNNLYIDNITSGTMTGTQTPITLTPEKFELSQNYPNPFNPSTSIKYSIPSNSLVTMKIYNALGKEVATLVNENKPAGSYELNFDASNLSSGVYFYKIEAGNFSDIKRMVLVK